MRRAADWISRSSKFAGEELHLPRRGQGFTLIELMVVVAILAILIGLAAPAFRDLILNQRVKNASFDVFASLVMARSEAITRNTNVWICSNSGVEWKDGWTVKTTDCAGTTIRAQDSYPNVSITGPASLSYNGMGRLTGAATISLTATGVSVANSRCIDINASGRPVTKTGTCP